MRNKVRRCRWRLAGRQALKRETRDQCAFLARVGKRGYQVDSRNAG